MLKKLVRSIKKTTAAFTKKAQDKDADNRSSYNDAGGSDPFAPGTSSGATRMPPHKGDKQPAVPSSWPCPPYAAKSVVGQRLNMEDSWQAVPDLMQVPKWWLRHRRDLLPVAPPPRSPEPDATAPQAPQEPPAADPPPPGGPAAEPAEAAAQHASDADAPPSGSFTLRRGDTSSSGHLDATALIALHGTDPVTLHFFAVYDGHGGADVAKHCAKHLHENLKRIVGSKLANGTPRSTPAAQPSAAPAPDASPAGPLALGSGPLASVSNDATSAASNAGQQHAAAAPTGPDKAAAVDGLEVALKSAFLQTDSDLAGGRSAHEVGTTAVVSLLSATTLFVGNVGDSRALLCRDAEAVALSLDHKATRMDEVSRVEAAGGYVWWDRVMGELAVSRAIGDHCLRPFVIAEPEVTYVMRRPEDQLLVMASDGLWDVFTNDEARQLALEKFRGEYVKTNSSKQAVKKAASSLAKAALAKGSRDNITVIVVDVRTDPSRPTGPISKAPRAERASSAAGSDED